MGVKRDGSLEETLFHLQKALLCNNSSDSESFHLLTYFYFDFPLFSLLSVRALAFLYDGFLSSTEVDRHLSTLPLTNEL